eukprot:3928250-Rhodomonas_salina.3
MRSLFEWGKHEELVLRMGIDPEFHGDHRIPASIKRVRKLAGLGGGGIWLDFCVSNEDGLSTRQAERCAFFSLSETLNALGLRDHSISIQIQNPGHTSVRIVGDLLCSNKF